MALPTDYAERVYAGVLGKLIGVYLGRPVEGWSYDRISREIGEIDRYLSTHHGTPLVVTDDDISGTFTFLRALPDHGLDPNLTPGQIGQTWLNYLIEERTILWWGGLGNSTEHTAYLRLKHGVPAPESGAMALNGKTIAEQIGSQIFIDGWAMICPGDPERAADFARRAASVSHDGEAIYGAQVVAAMEAQAFVEPDINILLDTAVSLIPPESTIARLIANVREWHAAEPDWRRARERIAAIYGYDTYGGACHMVPNHALIIHALLYGNDDFQRSLMIVNTSGWDTDCNAGNVGCLLGIKNGLSTIDDSPVDWRGPVADRLYLATADGGRAISDAVTETVHVVNMGRGLAGEAPWQPNDGARFHFGLPGSVQGFSTNRPQSVTVSNSATGNNQRSLAITIHDLPPGETARIATPTFIPPEAITMPGYTLLASPTLYPGQHLQAALSADVGNRAPIVARLVLRAYDANDSHVSLPGPEVSLRPGEREDLHWRIPETGGAPIAVIGIDVTGPVPDSATVFLEFLAWSGAPDVVLTRPAGVSAQPGSGGQMWRRAWVDGVDQFQDRWADPYRIVQNEGTGLISQGTADWVDYHVGARVTPYLATAAGLGARVQGMRRYYALVLHDRQQIRLVKMRDTETVLGTSPFAWSYFEPHDLALAVDGNQLRAWIDGQLVFDVVDDDHPLSSGGVALVVTEGCLGSEAVRVRASGEPNSIATRPS